MKPTKRASFTFFGEVLDESGNLFCPGWSGQRGLTNRRIPGGKGGMGAGQGGRFTSVDQMHSAVLSDCFSLRSRASEDRETVGVQSELDELSTGEPIVRKFSNLRRERPAFEYVRILRQEKCP